MPDPEIVKQSPCRHLALPALALSVVVLLAACDQNEHAEATDSGAPAEEMSADATPTMDEYGTPIETASTQAPAEPAMDDKYRATVAELAKSWPAEPPYKVNFDPIDPNVKVTDFKAAAKFNPADDYNGLPRDGAYELVDAYCTACHSIRIVMQQHATTERWDSLLTWMRTEQGMPELEPDERRDILAYLEKHFGPAGETATP